MSLSQRLRFRIDIEDLLITQDPETGAQTEDWGKFANDVPADVLPLSGSELLKADAAESTVRVRFVIRYGLAVTARMRILHDGLTYNIVSDPIPDPSLRRHLTIQAEAGLRDG